MCLLLIMSFQQAFIHINVFIDYLFLLFGTCLDIWLQFVSSVAFPVRVIGENFSQCLARDPYYSILLWSKEQGEHVMVRIFSSVVFIPSET